MKIKVGLIFSGIACLFLTACVNQVKQNTTFENTLTQNIVVMIFSIKI